MRTLNALVSVELSKSSLYFREQFDLHYLPDSAAAIILGTNSTFLAALCRP